MSHGDSMVSSAHLGDIYMNPQFLALLYNDQNMISCLLAVALYAPRYHNRVQENQRRASGCEDDHRTGRPGTDPVALLHCMG